MGVCMAVDWLSDVGVMSWLRDMRMVRLMMEGLRDMRYGCFMRSMIMAMEWLSPHLIVVLVRPVRMVFVKLIS
jgi:hypothetical protein